MGIVEWWRIVDSCRALQDARVWGEPLVRRVDSESDRGNMNKDIAFGLTKYDKKIWKGIAAETSREPQ